MPRSTTKQTVSNVMQLRLTDVQHRYVVLQAHLREISQGQVLRELVDAAIADAPPVYLEGEESLPRSKRSSIPLSAVLAGADRDAIAKLADELKRS